MDIKRTRPVLVKDKAHIVHGRIDKYMIEHSTHLPDGTLITVKSGHYKQKDLKKSRKRVDACLLEYYNELTDDRT